MSDALRSFSTRTTPQHEQARPDQVENRAGGFVWEVDQWARLHRFLILGVEGGTYYVGPQRLTRESAKAVLDCIAADGPRTVSEIVAVSQEGRAASNDPALFALALASKHGDAETRRLAYDALNLVARIGTHLFHFVAFREQFGGWSRGLRRAVARWYEGRDDAALAYQLVKYRQRDGWSHRDVMRLAHPKAPNAGRAALFDFACDRDPDLLALTFDLHEQEPTDEQRQAMSARSTINGFLKAQAAARPADTAALVRQYRLPREALQTEHLTDPAVWEAMVETDMPIGALIRNLATMTRVGYLKPLSGAERDICEKLRDAEAIKKARVHPISVLSALAVYGSGGAGGRSQAESFLPSDAVVKALENAYRLAFGNVEPANKRTLIGLDVSGSMANQVINGLPFLSARTGAAAMATITAATEPYCHTVAFTGNGGGYMRGTNFLAPFPLTGDESLRHVMQAMAGWEFGRTDCALPMLYATEQGLDVDTFVIYTDNETWCGSVQPFEALRQYREKSGIAARLAVVGMTADRFTIADPNDAGMLDVVGFDTATPNLLSAFSRGALS